MKENVVSRLSHFQAGASSHWSLTWAAYNNNVNSKFKKKTTGLGNNLKLSIKVIQAHGGFLSVLI